jgi:hypothetical protein
MLLKLLSSEMDLKSRFIRYVVIKE